MERKIIKGKGKERDENRINNFINTNIM